MLIMICGPLVIVLVVNHHCSVPTLTGGGHDCIVVPFLGEKISIYFRWTVSKCCSIRSSIWNWVKTSVFGCQHALATLNCERDKMVLEKAIAADPKLYRNINGNNSFSIASSASAQLFITRLMAQWGKRHNQIYLGTLLVGFLNDDFSKMKFNRWAHLFLPIHLA